MIAIPVPAVKPQYAETLTAARFVELCTYASPGGKYHWNADIARQEDGTFSVDLMFTYRHRRYCTAALWGFAKWNDARKTALAYAADQHRRIARTRKAPKKVQRCARIPLPPVQFQKTPPVGYDPTPVLVPGHLPPHLTARELVEEAAWGSPRNTWEPLIDLIGKPEHLPTDDLVRNVRDLDKECPNCGQMRCSCCLKCRAQWAFLEPIEHKGRFYTHEDAAKMTCRCPKAVLSATHEERAEKREHQRCGECGGVSPFATELRYVEDEPVCSCAPKYLVETDFAIETEGLDQYTTSH